MLTSLIDSSPEHKAQYLEAMRLTIPQKAKLIFPWLDEAETVVDLGCADGILAEALLYESPFVIGIDMCEEAIAECNRMKIRTGQDGRRLKFIHDTAEGFALERPADAVVCCSILHEVFSYSKEIDPFTSLQKTLTNIHRNLRHGGRLIIRDFIAPESTERVDFEHVRTDVALPALNYTMFHNLRRTDAVYGWNFIGEDHQTFYRYRFQKMRDVYEFIFHKDFVLNWETEIQETFAFGLELKPRICSRRLASKSSTMRRLTIRGLPRIDWKVRSASPRMDILFHFLNTSPSSSPANSRSLNEARAI
jgi:SAM-dependent methyltransferase